jgi:hypothetical protein
MRFAFFKELVRLEIKELKNLVSLIESSCPPGMPLQHPNLVRTDSLKWISTSDVV